MVERVLFSPTTAGDILERAVFVLAVEPLVGGGLAERSEMAYERTNLDVVEISLCHAWCNAQTSAVPGYMQ